MFDLWTKGWRRRRILRRPTPGHWPELLRTRLWYWEMLDAEQRHRLLQLTAIFVHEKEIVVPAEIRPPETARVLIAANASLLLLGFDDWYCFDRIRTIIVTRQPFRQRITVDASSGLNVEVPASGVYRQGAPLTLSWQDVMRDAARPDRGGNVVIHEFAHHIDDLDGALAGDPPFPTREQRRRWSEASEQAQEELAERTALHLPTVLDDYGLTSEVEFFAVTCEAFYCRPHELAEEYPELFKLLRELFRLDPCTWFSIE